MTELCITMKKKHQSERTIKRHTYFYSLESLSESNGKGSKIIILHNIADKAIKYRMCE